MIADLASSITRRARVLDPIEVQRLIEEPANEIVPIEMTPGATVDFADPAPVIEAA